MPKLRVIGDVHGRIRDYTKLTKDCDYSVQIGDMGFKYAELDAVNPQRHVFFMGNHDRYNLEPPLHCLGDYGPMQLGNTTPFYFVRGAASLDGPWRTIGLDYFPGYEEIDPIMEDDLFESYTAAAPILMLSHDAPEVAGRVIIEAGHGLFGPNYRPSRTSSILQRCFELHKPKLWVFGHHHVAMDMVIQGVRFQCLPELAYADIEEVKDYGEHTGSAEER